jgi:hypothetical protein
VGATVYDSLCGEGTPLCRGMPFFGYRKSALRRVPCDWGSGVVGNTTATSGSLPFHRQHDMERRSDKTEESMKRNALGFFTSLALTAVAFAGDVERGRHIAQHRCAHAISLAEV